MHFLGYRHPREQDLVATLLKAQRPDGSWEAYYARAAGRHQRHRRMLCRAALRRHSAPTTSRSFARGAGSSSTADLRGIRVFTRYWLALLGEWPWSATPNLPPEVIANPRWWFNMYNFASWARATLLPLAVLSARRAVRPLPPERRLDELFPDGRDKMDYRLPRRSSWLSWRRLFLVSRPATAFLPTTRLHTGPRDGDQRVLGLDRAPPRRRWRVGRDSTAVDLQPDGAQRRGLHARAPRHVEGARGARQPLVVRARRHAAHPGERVAGVGHAAVVARHAGLRARVHAAHGARTRLGARERGALPRRLVEEGQGRRAERLGVRAREPPLPRHRRHGRRADRARALAARAARPAADPRGDRPRARLDARDAVVATAAGPRSTRTTTT